MNSSHTSKLSLPARKIFLKDICAGISTPNESAIANLHVWSVHVRNKEQKVSIVWIQGNVTQVVCEEDCFYIDDSTTVARVTGASKLPHLNTSLATGKYMLVVGEVVEAGELPTIRAMKVQDLSEDPMAEALWVLEVLDLQQHGE